MNFDEYRNRVFSMLYDSRHNAQTILTEHLGLAKKFEQPLLSGVVPHANDKRPDRRLKIGYVSPDFRRHSVAYFIQPVLAAHNREQFEIFCYPLIPHEDEVTRRIRDLSGHWQNLSGMDDHRAAEHIRKDEIDILIDLSGHIYGSLLIFARKPAPVQATWIGYPATTGFSSIDYKIVDSYTDPPGLTESFYSEKLVRMPSCLLCYQPDPCSPEVNPLPALTSGEITFGSFNTFSKITSGVVALWSAILKRVPDSSLLLKPSSFTDGKIFQNLKNMFAKNGIDSGQLELFPFAASFSGHLKTYSQVDIALDPFPYNGGTTTCEALWMGVPVITLEGNTHASRMGVSLLSNVGLPELIAKTETDYAELAVNLARNVKKLKFLRSNLRAMMTKSRLCDSERFTVELETCYRTMWAQWCTI